MGFVSRPLALGSGITVTTGVLWWYNRQRQKAKEPIWVVNGFYTAMREKYTRQGACVHWFLVRWDSRNMTWETFREDLLGTTDPSQAKEGSLRRTIFDQWKHLRLSEEPTLTNNSIHASASPLEGCIERSNWGGGDFTTFPFVQNLLQRGIKKDTVLSWMKDPQVELDNVRGSLFDFLEDLDSVECIETCAKIAGCKEPAPPLYCWNEAIVMIKPHAYNDRVLELVRLKLTDAHIGIVEECAVGNEEIDQMKLVDKHFYTVSSKAMKKPSELQPAQEKRSAFERKWGLSWDEVVKKGRVFNAVDACERLAIGGAEMEALWMQAKGHGELIKMGRRGFYVGRINPQDKPGIE